MKSNNPFADSELPLDYGLRGKDVVQPAIEESEDAFTLSGIRYRNGFYRVDWGKALLHHGMHCFPDQWLKLGYINLVPDVPLYAATFIALQSMQDSQNAKLIKRLADMLLDDFQTHMAVNTKVAYHAKNAAGPDAVIHGHNTSLGMLKQAEISEHYLVVRTDTEHPQALEALLDVNVARFEQAYNAFTGKTLEVWLLRERYDREVQRHAGWQGNALMLNDNIVWLSKGGRVRPAKVQRIIGGVQ